MTVTNRLFALAILLVPARLAGAQTLPWPGEPGAPALKPWPNGAPQAGAPAAPGRGAPVTGDIPLNSRGLPCMEEFTKLREEVQKKRLAAKAAGQKNVAREELCKLVTSYAASEAEWVRFTEAGVGTCGIPLQIATELKQVHANTEQIQEKICTAGLGGRGVGRRPATLDRPLVGDFWDFRGPNGDGFLLRGQ
jgi:hypothetical protein